MRDRHRRTSASDRPEARIRRDATRSELQALADQLGNEAMASLVARGLATREELIGFVTARLQRVAAVQERELALTHREGAHWREWRAMGDGHRPRSTEGAPARWGEVAIAYERAVQAAARGDLDRARQLVTAARTVEERVLRETTDLVRTDDLVCPRAVPEPAGLADAVLAATVEPVEVPGETRDLIRRIVDVTAQMPRMRGLPRVPSPRWPEEEEEDEEQDDG